MIMNVEQAGMWNKAAVAYFRVSCWNFTECTGKTRETVRIGNHESLF
jgi:hypothetical protein